MKFISAERKLKEAVGNMYRSLIYEKTFSTDGSVETKCRIYVNTPRGVYSGHDWNEAFTELEKAMKLKPIEEIPGEETDGK